MFFSAITCIALAASATVDGGVSEDAALPLEFARVERFFFSVDGQDTSLLIYTDDRPRAVAAAQRVRETLTATLDALDARRADSALSRLARAEGQPVALSPEVFDAVAEALRVARLSSGAYDPTAAPLAELWGFSGAGSVPDAATVKAALAQVDYRRLHLDATRHTARLQTGSSLDLGPLRRGAALQRAAVTLLDAGLEHFVLRLGSDLVVRGTKGEQPWMVGVQDPRSSGYFAAFAASDGAVATVADYERFFFREGVRFHHVLDPRTGVPARQARSATVIASNAELAAALAQAVFVLGPEAGLDLVGRLHQVEALVVDDRNRVHMSEGIADQVRYRPPTDGP